MTTSEAGKRWYPGAAAQRGWLRERLDPATRSPRDGAGAGRPGTQAILVSAILGEPAQRYRAERDKGYITNKLVQAASGDRGDTERARLDFQDIA